MKEKSLVIHPGTEHNFIFFKLGYVTKLEGYLQNLLDKTLQFRASKIGITWHCFDFYYPTMEGCFHILGLGPKVMNAVRQPGTQTN